MLYCDTCPFYTSDPDAVIGHETRGPANGWFGRNETHRMHGIGDPNVKRICYRAMTTRDCSYNHDWYNGVAYGRIYHY